MTAGKVGALALVLFGVIPQIAMLWGSYFK